MSFDFTLPSGCIYVCVKQMFERSICTIIRCNITDGLVSLQLMKTKCEPLPSDLNCMCCRSRMLLALTLLHSVLKGREHPLPQSCGCTLYVAQHLHCEQTGSQYHLGVLLHGVGEQDCLHTFQGRSMKELTCGSPPAYVLG